MFTTDDWKVLVEAVLSATESGELQWALDGDPLDLERKPNALNLVATFDGSARIDLFGRFRGYSYSIEIYRDGAESYEFQDSITVKSKANSHGIPFDVLFKSALAQVRESRKRTMEENRDRWVAWALNCLELLPGHDHEIWDWDADSPEDWVAELTADQWDLIVSKVIACTESKKLTWSQDDRVTASGGNRWYMASIDEAFALSLVIDGNNETFEFTITDPREALGGWEDRGVLFEYSGGQLERLAEHIGASSRRQFQEILKNEALQGFLKGLGKK